MRWEIEYTNEFAEWWDTLNEAEQESVDGVVRLLEEKGPQLGFPYSSDIKGADTAHLRELRIQHAGKPYRVPYAFDPRRTAILLTGGRKSDDRWYERFVPEADRLYKEHIAQLKSEGLA